ncbi:MAG TPA: DMT family transporter [Termitinemataceae bacterium]|nr:DMT family transporter [Termitinemataceae bacterium]HOM23215.1 DMT family transporter [Termitinemataceae bacterium]HPQ00401.1 DMT family transporter [Termitinemataceae bacterium]
MRKTTKGLIKINGAVMFWGVSFVSIKIAVAVIPPMTLGALRFALALLFLYGIKKWKAPEEKLQKGDGPYLVGAGLVGVTAYFFFENHGVALIPASEASIIVAAIPVFSMLAEQIASALFSQKTKPLHLLQWFGAALSMLGVWCITLPSLSGAMETPGMSDPRGYLFMLGAVVSWVLYAFLTRPLFSRHSNIFIVFWQSLFGFLGFLPFTLSEQAQWSSIPALVWAHVGYLGIFCSALGYLFYVEGLETLGVGTSSVFINLIPVVTLGTAFISLGERLTPIQLVGTALVLGGIYLATLPKTHHFHRPPDSD